MVDIRPSQAGVRLGEDGPRNIVLSLVIKAGG